MKLAMVLLGLTLTRASCGASARPTPPPTSAGGVEIVAPDDADGGTRRRGPREVAAQHVLVMYRGSSRAPASVTRTRDQARTRADEVLRRARAGEDFGALAGEFSDEPNAAERGGALPLFRRGQMAEEFERAAFALEVGAISDVVETEFGFHVIKRTE